MGIQREHPTRILYPHSALDNQLIKAMFGSWKMLSKIYIYILGRRFSHVYKTKKRISKELIFPKKRQIKFRKSAEFLLSWQPNKRILFLAVFFPYIFPPHLLYLKLSGNQTYPKDKTTTSIAYHGNQPHFNSREKNPRSRLQFDHILRNEWNRKP